MKQRIRNILSFLCCAALLVAAIFKCADVLEHKNARIKYDDFFQAETNHDVVLLGTSMMANTILPMELWKEYGITAYNWGNANCGPAVSYYLIPEILKYTSPKVLVLDLNGFLAFDEYGNKKYRTDRIEQYHVQFDEIPLSLNKYRGTQDVFDDYPGNLDFMWNFAMYHNRWSELTEEDFVYEPSTEKGAHYLMGWTKATFTPIDREETIKLWNQSYSYLLKILEYCSQNEIQLLCTFVPVAATPLYQKVANSLGPIIESYEHCHYLNMLYEDIVDFEVDSFDGVHHNYSGACKTTSYLGKYLKEHYDLEDYSQHPAWKEDYGEYLHFKEKRLLEPTSLVKYLVALYGDSYDSTLEIYDPKLPELELLEKMAENNSIQVVIKPGENKIPVRLKVTDPEAQRVILDRYFGFKDLTSQELLNLTRMQPNSET